MVHRKQLTPTNWTRSIRQSLCGWGCLGLALLPACACRCRAKTEGASLAASTSALPKEAGPRDGASQPAAERSVEPRRLLTLKESAYRARIALDEDSVFVLTSRAAFRIVPGAEAEEIPLDLGLGAALAAGSLVYWSKGAVWQIPKSGGKPRRAAAMARRPEYFIASGEHFAWVDRSEAGQFTLGALSAVGPKVIYSSPGSIDAATMAHDAAFFVERNEATWRIGRVPRTGGAAAFTADRPGRSPSMLALGRDRICYYQGNQRQVRCLTNDLGHDEVIAEEVICSPIAAWDSVYCGHVRGLFEIPLDTRQVRLVTRNDKNLVTQIATSSAGVAWLSETGDEQLAVRMLPRQPR